MGAPTLLSSIRRKSNKAAVAPPPPLTARHDNKNNNILKNHSSSNERKKPMRLKITPDAESESMQVMIIPESPPNTQTKIVQVVEEEEDLRMYRVGSAEYLVKHSANSNGYNDGAAQKRDSKAITSTNVTAGEKKENRNGSQSVKKNTTTNIVGETSAIKTNAMQNDCIEVAGEGGGSDKKKKSRFGFKKSPKKGKDDGDNQKASSNNNNNNNNDDQNGDKKDSKDNGKDEKKDSSNGNNHNGPNRPGENVSFTPERIQFATESTLPLHPGSESTAPTSHPSWTPVDGTEFKVRTGPNYSKHGKKEASLESLYEVYCVRYFRSQKRTEGGATRIMPLPEMGARDGIKEEGDAGEGGEAKVDASTTTTSNGSNGRVGSHHPELKNTKVPDVLVVHFMLPYETPNMFKQKEDGPGGECVYYLRPSARLLDEMSGRKPISPATQLFARWCAECQGDLKMRSRFKCMALVRDIDKHNFGLLKSYNGKPVLITE
eukprot:CAMPEP_0201671522 /NCGR_PEP_ID=MMETSP0494-20130426/29861_1 /ASSEMBLY_ACC=CAM_ASM_000839 /TAXON_ID=420259 /ORGANISM="Thalassiosira gravida, Strain GMp14c1" /LENGTH=488 /DNA_ID=CAMNT_0048152911 /DNA_START=64 /DNA_END=1527 /DNA_ORIENTATION=-